MQLRCPTTSSKQGYTTNNSSRVVNPIAGLVTLQIFFFLVNLLLDQNLSCEYSAIPVSTNKICFDGILTEYRILCPEFCSLTLSSIMGFTILVSYNKSKVYQII